MDVPALGLRTRVSVTKVISFVGMSGVHDNREQALARFYDALARYAWWARRLSRARPGEALAMRKTLRRGAGNLAGVEDLNSWLWSRVAPKGEPRVLDVGAGFGDTVLSWAREHAGQYLGLGLSRFQTTQAVKQAELLGLSESCRFQRSGFDDSPAGPFDVIVSIETLLYSSDVRGTIQHLASCLAPGGTIVMVEDVAASVEVAASPAGRELLDRWLAIRLPTHAEYVDAIRAAGLKLEFDMDLSHLLVLLAPADRERRARRLRRLRQLLPIGRSVVDAFLGGLAMEELQNRGELSYRVLGATCPR